MGQRELLLTIGAIVIFSITSLSINRSMLRNSEAIYSRQAEIFAMSVAQQFIEEAKTKAFDENTIIDTGGSPSIFTGSPLGPGGGENYPYFDDIDDYNGFSTTDSDILGEMITSVNISVNYVNDTNLEVAVSSRTYYKKMRVTVNSDYFDNPVTAEYVFAFQKNP